MVKIKEVKVDGYKKVIEATIWTQSSLHYRYS